MKSPFQQYVHHTDGTITLEGHPHVRSMRFRTKGARRRETSSGNWTCRPILRSGKRSRRLKGSVLAWCSLCCWMSQRLAYKAIRACNRD